MKCLALATIFAAIAPVFAVEIQIYGDFKDSKPDAEVPAYWGKNIYTNGPEIGTGADLKAELDPGK